MLDYGNPWEHIGEDNYDPGRPQPATLAVPVKGSPEERAAAEYASVYGAPTPAWVPDTAAEVPPTPTIRDAALAAFDDQGRMAAEAEASRRGLSPYDVAGAVGMGSSQAAADAYGMAQAAATQGRHTVTTSNPFAAPVRAYTGATRAADAAGLQAVTQGQAIERDQAQRVADYMLDERARIAATTAAQYEAEQTRAQKAIEMDRRAKAIQIEVDRAADKFAKAPVEDRGRFWASRTGWQKFALALSAGMKGWLQGQGYNIDPMAQINEAIRMDIDEQRSNRSLLGEKLTNRQKQAAEARSTYTQLLDQFGDDRIAENMLETARLKEAQAHLAQLAAGMDAERLGPAHAKLQSDLAAEIAKKELERRSLEIKTPPTISRTITNPNVVVTGPDGKQYLVPRSFAMQQATAGAKRSGELQDKGIDITAKTALAEGETTAKIAIAEATARAKAAAKGGLPPAENMRFIAKETAVPNRVRALASDMLKIIEQNKGDVPGVGWYIPGVGAAKHTLTEEARRFAKLRDQLSEYDITDLTGAVSSPEQRQTINAFLDGSETEIGSGLREIQRAMDTYVNTIEGADPAAAKAIREHTNKGLEGWRGANVSPASESEAVEEDE